MTASLGPIAVEGGGDQPIRWGPLDSLVALLVAFVLAGLIGMLIAPAGVVFEKNGQQHLTINALGTLAFEAGLALIAVTMVRRRATGLSSLRLTTSGCSPVAVVLTLGAAYVAYFGYVFAISQAGVSWLEPSSQLKPEVFDFPITLVVLGSSVILLAPLAEEVFFRGLVFQGFTRFGVLPASILTGLIFSLAHANIGAIVPFTIIGAVFALSLQKTGSLLTPISAHAAFNAISFIALLSFPELRP